MNLFNKAFCRIFQYCFKVAIPILPYYNPTILDSVSSNGVAHYINTVNATYNAYLDLTTNTFIYTSEEKTPEVLINIYDPEGNEITTIENLEYVTVGDVSGFDITTKNGFFLVSSDYAISTTSTTVQTWQIKLTYLNLDTDQSLNSLNKLYLN